MENKCNLSLSLSIYIYVCVCVCVCVLYLAFYLQPRIALKSHTTHIVIVFFYLFLDCLSRRYKLGSIQDSVIQKRAM